MLQHKLGKRIAELRKARGLTQARLAKGAGCSVEFVSLVERGVKAPSVAGLEKFARALKAKVADLFAFGEPTTPGRRRNATVARQIPQDRLGEGRWYVGRGRNANVACWVRIGERLTFVTIGMKFGQPVVKDEGYYGPEDGCFQPFAPVEEGTVVEPVGPGPGWDAHYAKRLAI